jgi:hypothetical protein
MAILLDRSEQIAALFEVVSVRDGWVLLHIAFQHYVVKENDFATWVDGLLDVHESDFSAFLRELAAFVKAVPARRDLSFEPAVEPSFEFRLQIGSSARKEDVVAFAALDLKGIMEVTVPAVYRDNRVSLQILTDSERLRRFVEQFSHEATKASRSQSPAL